MKRQRCRSSGTIFPSFQYMILNTGARTDTVQYFTEWLLRRFREGYVYSRNPLFPDKVTRYELVPDKIDCVEFCSKNYRPILNDLHEITDRFNTHFQYTITAYGKDIEPRVPSIDESMDTLLELEEQVGRQRICWRYDPVLLTGVYTVERHMETFDRMCDRLAGHVDRCIFSFVEMYRKLERNMPELFPISDRDKERIAEGFGRIAKEHGIPIQTCGTNGDFTRYGIMRSGCMTADILGRANGITFRDVKHRGMRKGCHCLESRDIGAYDTCPNGCRYCYANSSHERAMENYRLHDPKSPILIGGIKDTDIILQGSQESLLTRTCRNNQVTFDDL